MEEVKPPLPGVVNMILYLYTLHVKNFMVMFESIFEVKQKKVSVGNFYYESFVCGRRVKEAVKFSKYL